MRMSSAISMDCGKPENLTVVGNAFWADSLSGDSQVLNNYYYFIPDSEGIHKISISPVSESGEFECGVYDDNFTEIKHSYGNRTIESELSKRVYYICVKSGGSLCGNYRLHIEQAVTHG